MTSEDKGKRTFSDKINELFARDKYKQARTLLLKKMKTYPDDHWLLTCLSTTHYEERDYKTALRISKKALRLAPACPLAIWYHAGPLDMLNKEKEAIQLWKKLLNRNFERLAYGECGEGKRWTESLLNDCRYRIGNAYLRLKQNKQAKKYLRLHLKNRKRGLRSIYAKGEVLKQLRSTES